MEDILELYRQPHDPRFPVVCMDEMPKQLIAETRQPLPLWEGQPRRYDYEYERKGVYHVFLFFEPLRGWRKVWVRDQRTKVDWALCVRDLLDQFYAEAWTLRLVADNLNTHVLGSLYEAFPPEDARRLASRLELHPTPRHASWLNMAETELSILDRQCLDRRLDHLSRVLAEIEPWQDQRNQEQATIDWRFTIADARVKLKNVYPSIKI